MADDEPLLPPLSLLSKRLTRNQRERDLLRALFRLAIRAKEEIHEPAPHAPHQQADGREVGR